MYSVLGSRLPFYRLSRINPQFTQTFLFEGDGLSGPPLCLPISPSGRSLQHHLYYIIRYFASTSSLPHNTYFSPLRATPLTIAHPTHCNAEANTLRPQHHRSHPMPISGFSLMRLATISRFGGRHSPPLEVILAHRDLVVPGPRAIDDITDDECGRNDNQSDQSSYFRPGHLADKWPHFSVAWQARP